MQLHLVAEQFRVIFKILTPETARGSILIVSTMIENEMEAALSKRLLPKIEKEDELLSRGRAVETFAAKIDLAYRLGVITENERKIYHQLRKVRNLCAHKIEAPSFDSNDFKNHLKVMVNEAKPLWEQMAKIIGPQLNPEGKNYNVDEFIEAIGFKVAFEAFFSMIIAHKRTSLYRVTQLSPLHQPDFLS